jgi:hypothetical protein
MASRKLLLLAGALAAATLGGCAAYPYDDYAYQDERAYYTDHGPYYGPGYYVGPSVGFGITYVDRDRYWRRHRW